MAPSIPPQPIAIIGASIAGITFACSLAHHYTSTHQSLPKITIYDSRPGINLPTSAVMLCPNSLRILDELGIYDSLYDGGYVGSYVVYKDVNLRTTDRYCFGDVERWGYPSLRLHRWVLVEKLRDAVVEKLGLVIEYGCKFERVVEAEDGTVVIEFEGGRKERAGLLIGADGIHSSVRENAFPAVEKPKYTGILSVSGFVKRSKLRIPKDDGELGFPAIISGTGANSAFLTINQSHDGEEIMTGVNRLHPELDREEFAAIVADKEKMKSLFRGRKEDTWPDFVLSAIENLEEETLFLWPFYQLPKLESWISHSGNVVLIGDAAHAMPPPAGQGANQAVEDSWTLALVLAKLSAQNGVSINEALSAWQKMRMDRIGRVSVLNDILINARLPLEKRQPLNGKRDLKTEDLDLDWLYSTKPEEEVLNWFEQRGL